MATAEAPRRVIRTKVITPNLVNMTAQARESLRTALSPNWGDEYRAYHADRAQTLLDLVLVEMGGIR